MNDLRGKFQGFLAKYGHILCSVLLWTSYIVLFLLLKKHIAPTHFIYSPLDSLIPFVKCFFIPYCLWYLYLFVPQIYLAIAAKEDFIRLQRHMFTGLAICLLTFVVYPNGITFRPEVTGNDLISRVMASMYAVNAPTMVIPSMHVFGAASIHIGFASSGKTRGRRGLTALSLVFVLLVCASTVLVKQHSVKDIVWGLALAAALYFPFFWLPARLKR